LVTPCDVDDLAFLEDVGLDLAADLEVADLVGGHAQLPQAAAAFDLRLGEVTGFRLVQQRGALGAGGDLHGAVAVGLGVLTWVMRFGVASIRVTGTDSPSSVKIRLMPALRPTIPNECSSRSWSLALRSA
jgi:hypothetical protein